MKHENEVDHDVLLRSNARISELEVALKRQRDLTAHERKRADALADQVKTAFQVAWPVRLRSSDGT